MISTTIIIPGDPVAQPRPRVSTAGGFARAYVPADHPIHAYKHAIRLLWGNRGEPHQGPVEVVVRFCFQRPKSHSKKRREEHRHLQKPDADNLCKAVLDSLNGLAWVDDSQVFRLTAEKTWVDSEPFAIVTLKFS